MDLSNLLTIGGGGLLIILLGMIKIPKIEINIWGLLARGFGRAINKEMMDQVKDIKRDMNCFRTLLDNHVEDNKKENARRCRQRILRFNDEILQGTLHTKEHFDEILDDINSYEIYCDEHPDYKNNKAQLAIANVKKIYQECLDNNSFL